MAAPARFTGAPSEWDAVAADEAVGGGSLSLLKAVQRGGMLYLLAEGTAVDPGGVFLIDADGDPATGAQEPAWSDATGIDYRIVGTQVQRYADGAWTPAGTAAYANSGTIAEAAVDIGLLGLTASAPLKAAYAEPAANAFLPDAGKPMLAVEAEAAAFGPDPDIAVDGDPADWSGSEPVAVSADGLTKLYAAANGDTLSVMVSGKMGDWNDVFIDTDHSKDTGFTTNWLWPDYGFDYMMENGALYASTGSGWGWSQLAAEDIQYAESGSGNDKVIEMSAPLGELGMTAPRAAIYRLQRRRGVRAGAGRPGGEDRAFAASRDGGRQRRRVVKHPSDRDGHRQYPGPVGVREKRQAVRARARLRPVGREKPVHRRGQRSGDRPSGLAICLYRRRLSGAERHGIQEHGQRLELGSAWRGGERRVERVCAVRRKRAGDGRRHERLGGEFDGAGRAGRRRRLCAGGIRCSALSGRPVRTGRADRGRRP
ncbi:hypothetical protein [Cohnella rhizosphaerae]|uniref:Uncharacterized protein n=1 Tax=Cohnella rhizosphaerae TaxID=1457232 RepID=A0A9X4QRR4_9BACL|nr:hypothetical protein [Cohnella rhizosphaerae]MDG0808543.1 hypothetical protein [Cohnella rhizosphaerae]